MVSTHGHAWSCGYIRFPHDLAWIPFTFETIWLHMLEIATILSALSMRSLLSMSNSLDQISDRNRESSISTCKSLRRADEDQASSLQHRFVFFFRSTVWVGFERLRGRYVYDADIPLVYQRSVLPQKAFLHELVLKKFEMFSSSQGCRHAFATKPSRLSESDSLCLLSVNAQVVRYSVSPTHLIFHTHYCTLDCRQQAANLRKWTCMSNLPA